MFNMKTTPEQQRLFENHNILIEVTTLFLSGMYVLFSMTQSELKRMALNAGGSRLLVSSNKVWGTIVHTFRK